jgi:hypothetical protein
MHSIKFVSRSIRLFNICFSAYKERGENECLEKEKRERNNLCGESLLLDEWSKYTYEYILNTHPSDSVVANVCSSSTSDHVKARFSSCLSTAYWKHFPYRTLSFLSKPVIWSENTPFSPPSLSFFSTITSYNHHHTAHIIFPIKEVHMTLFLNHKHTYIKRCLTFLRTKETLSSNTPAWKDLLVKDSSTQLTVGHTYIHMIHPFRYAWPLLGVFQL